MHITGSDPSGNLYEQASTRSFIVIKIENTRVKRSCKALGKHINMERVSMVCWSLGTQVEDLTAMDEAGNVSFRGF